MEDPEPIREAELIVPADGNQPTKPQPPRPQHIDAQGDYTWADLPMG